MILEPIAPPADQDLAREVARRRTFAIISHPDAGKTTLTEKLLLYAGSIEEAGAVRARRSQRQVVSDWMAIEQERGISVTSTVLQFEHEGCMFNLLDTPGHQDFSEDAYRTLMAVDSAIMVLDSAKGIEAQTRKLFAVCRKQRLPILTFINKMDQPGRDPLELLDEIEDLLSIRAAPMNWPVGDGTDFHGVYDLQSSRILLFDRSGGRQSRAPMLAATLPDEGLARRFGPRVYGRLMDDIALLEGLGASYDAAAFRSGDLTPVYFGSALNNFGVEPFLNALIELAPPPGPRASNQGPVRPSDADFSGFVFKIQANMDPRHRDRMAFIRVCSGRFEKDMTVFHTRLNRPVRMSRPHRLFAQKRATADEAFPGDVIGLTNPGLFVVGDTVASSPKLQFAPIPPFQPEYFGLLRNLHVDKSKQFNKGVSQLAEEGVIQVLYPEDAARREPILAAVGMLQFDVVVARLAAEYQVEARIEPLEYTCARWVRADDPGLATAHWTAQSLLARDGRGHFVLLFPSEWAMKYCMDKNPQIRFETVDDLVLQTEAPWFSAERPDPA
ncbi:MAG TPA: peptide chain release factor 3 [Anaerolineae bacterium]|nr:peptide chain release factor 3 [Anaerolineae bacterium]